MGPITAGSKSEIILSGLSPFGASSWAFNLSVRKKSLYAADVLFVIMQNARGKFSPRYAPFTIYTCSKFLGTDLNVPSINKTGDVIIILNWTSDVNIIFRNAPVSCCTVSSLTMNNFPSMVKVKFCGIINSAVAGLAG